MKKTRNLSKTHHPPKKCRQKISNKNMQKKLQPKKFIITCKIENLKARLDTCYHPRDQYESKKWLQVPCAHKLRAYKFIVGKICQRVPDKAHHPHY